MLIYSLNLKKCLTLSFYLFFAFYSSSVFSESWKEKITKLRSEATSSVPSVKKEKALSPLLHSFLKDSSVLVRLEALYWIEKLELQKKFENELREAFVDVHNYHAKKPFYVPEKILPLLPKSNAPLLLQAHLQAWKMTSDETFHQKIHASLSEKTKNISIPYSKNAYQKWNHYISSKGSKRISSSNSSI